MTKTILAISLSAILAIGLFASPLGVDAMGSFLDIKKGTIDVKKDEFKKAEFKTKAKIPTDGSGGAFGYGVISGAGLEAIAVTTTHPGVKDSEAQSGPNDASFHNHYVALQNSQTVGTGYCPGLEVRDITFQEPGDVKVKKKKATMKDVPFSFSGTHSLTNAAISFLADENVGAAVSFTIDPVDATGNTNPNDIQAVCINDVVAAEKLKVK